MKKILFVLLTLVALMSSLLVNSRPIAADDTVPVVRYNELAAAYERLRGVVHELVEKLNTMRKERDDALELLFKSRRENANYFRDREKEFQERQKSLERDKESYREKIRQEADAIIVRELEKSNDLLRSIEDELLTYPEPKSPRITVQPVLFFAKDREVPADVESQALVLGKRTRIVQLFYQKKLDGATFGLKAPVVVRGERFLADYGRYGGTNEVDLIRRELPKEEGTVYLVFSYGRTDPINWGEGQYYNTAVINEEVRIALLNGKWWPLGLVAHELAHAISGLPDRPDGSLMDNRTPDTAYGLFPAVDFTDGDKKQLGLFL